MYIYVIIIFLVLSSLFLGSKKRIDSFIYLFLFLVVFLRFFSEKLFPFQGNQVMSLFLRTGVLFFVVLFGLFFSVKKMFNERLLYMILISCSYILIVGMFRTVAYQYLSLYTTLISFVFFMLLLLALRNRLSLKVETVVDFSIKIGIFQAFLGILQFFAPQSWMSSLTLQRYSTDAQGKVVIGLADLDVGTMVQGTLNRFNTFGNFQAYILILHLGYNIFYKKNLSFKSVLVALILGYSIVLSGNRASFLSLIGGGIVLLFYYRRTMFFVFLSIFLPFFVSANLFIEKIIAGGAQTTTNPLERLMTSFVIFKSGASLQDTGSTLFYSYSLIPDFLNNFVFGGGKYFLRGYQFVGANSSVGIYDTTLMTLLTEFGIIGFIIILLPYLYIYSFIRKNFKGRPEYPLFIGLIALFLLQTVTDPGIFAEDSTYLFGALIIGFYIALKREKKIMQPSGDEINSLNGTSINRI